MEKNNYFVKTLLDIFGYSVVGMLSFVFGLVLQNYNTNGQLLFGLIKYLHIAPQIYILIIVQILLICLFGHSYAVSILYKNELREGAGLCCNTVKTSGVYPHEV